MMFKKLWMSIVWVSLTLMLLSACSANSSMRLGWACFNGLRKMDCGYREFTGREFSQ